MASHHPNGESEVERLKRLDDICRRAMKAAVRCREAMRRLAYE